MWLSKPSVTKACKFSLLISLRHDRTVGTGPLLWAVRSAAPVQRARVASDLFARSSGHSGVGCDLRLVGPRVQSDSRPFAAARRSAFVSRPENERTSRSVRTLRLDQRHLPPVWHRPTSQIREIQFIITILLGKSTPPLHCVGRLLWCPSDSFALVFYDILFLLYCIAFNLVPTW